MRQVLIFIALGCCFLCSYAQGHKPPPNGWQIAHLLGRVEKLKETSDGRSSIHYYDERGYEVKCLRYDNFGLLTYTITCRYNERGEVVEYSSGSKEPLSRMVYHYKYDSTGNTLESEGIPEGETTGYRVEYTYDNIGNKVKSISHGRDGTVTETTQYEYDSSGHLLSETRYLPENKELKLKYDIRGNMVEHLFSSPDGKITEILTYDDKGNMTSHTMADPASSDNTVVYNYDYDAQGNWIKKRNSLDADRTEEREIEYYH